MTAENPVKALAAQFGSMSAMARALGHKNVTTVQYWCSTGIIPPRRLAEVSEACAGKGIPFSVESIYPASAGAA